MYSLVSGRSGTNKSGSLSLAQKIIEELPSFTPRRKQQHVFDSGKMEGLMCTLRDNDGSIMCAVDEFGTFLNSIDKHSNGNAERARYLSLWSESRWSKKTKNCGLEEICQSRFQFAGFNQNYFLINMILNTNQYDGFLPRFLVSTPEEVYVKLQDKIIAAETLDGLEMSKLFALVFQTFFKDGCIFKLSEEAMVLFASYHDQEVLEFRKRIDSKT